MNVRQASISPFDSDEAYSESETTHIDSKEHFKSNSYEDTDLLIARNGRDTSSEDLDLIKWPSEITTSTRAPRSRQPRITFSPYHPHILYTLFPSLQSKTSSHYCPQNQYTFQLTCLHGKVLRYDLQIFCQEYSAICGVPNTNLYESRTGRPSSDGHPNDYGYRQKSGVIGLGRSFTLRLGVIPGFEVVASNGVDVGPIPILDQVGGFVVNQGTELEILGQRTGAGPVRSIPSFTHGYSSFGGSPTSKLTDLETQTGTGGSEQSLETGDAPRRSPQRSHEIGHRAVERDSPIAANKIDRNGIRLPSSLRQIEIIREFGLGSGKK